MLKIEKRSPRKGQLGVLKDHCGIYLKIICITFYTPSLQWILLFREWCGCRKNRLLADKCFVQRCNVVQGTFWASSALIFLPFSSLFIRTPIITGELQQAGEIGNNMAQSSLIKVMVVAILIITICETRKCSGLITYSDFWRLTSAAQARLVLEWTLKLWRKKNNQHKDNKLLKIKKVVKKSVVRVRDVTWALSAVDVLGFCSPWLSFVVCWRLHPSHGKPHCALISP